MFSCNLGICGQNHQGTIVNLCRGGGQVVSVLSFVSEDPSSNIAKVYIFLSNSIKWAPKWTPTKRNLK